MNILNLFTRYKLDEINSIDFASGVYIFCNEKGEKMRAGESRRIVNRVCDDHLRPLRKRNAFAKGEHCQFLFNEEWTILACEMPQSTRQQRESFELWLYLEFPEMLGNGGHGMLGMTGENHHNYGVRGKDHPQYGTGGKDHFNYGVNHGSWQKAPWNTSRAKDNILVQHMWSKYPSLHQLRLENTKYGCKRFRRLAVENGFPDVSYQKLLECFDDSEKHTRIFSQWAKVDWKARLSEFKLENVIA